MKKAKVDDSNACPHCGVSTQGTYTLQCGHTACPACVLSSRPQGTCLECGAEDSVTAGRAYEAERKRLYRATMRPEAAAPRERKEGPPPRLKVSDCRGCGGKDADQYTKVRRMECGHVYCMPRCINNGSVPCPMGCRWVPPPSPCLLANPSRLPFPCPNCGTHKWLIALRCGHRYCHDCVTAAMPRGGCPTCPPPPPGSRFDPQHPNHQFMLCQQCCESRLLRAMPCGHRVCSACISRYHGWCPVCYIPHNNPIYNPAWDQTPILETVAVVIPGGVPAHQQCRCVNQRIETLSCGHKFCRCVIEYLDVAFPPYVCPIRTCGQLDKSSALYYKQLQNDMFAHKRLRAHRTSEEAQQQRARNAEEQRRHRARRTPEQVERDRNAQRKWPH